MSRTTRHVLLGAALAAALLAGCGEDRPTAPERQPRAYHPERFPDIPLPPGFAIDPERDQLAVVMAGGLVRRFDVRVLEKPGPRQRPEAVLAWYDDRLPALGWTPEQRTGGRRTWTRTHPEGVAERLEIAAEGALATAVELRLRPAR